MKIRQLTLMLIPIALLAVLACEHTIPTEPEMPGGSQATLSRIQTTIFSQKCATSGCHVPGGTAPMAMRAVQESYANLVGVSSTQRPAIKRVTPNDPDNSYLLQKLQRVSGIQGDRMPPAGRPGLSSSEIDLIEEWISNGAENN